MNNFDVLLASKLGGGSGDTYTKAQIDAKLAEKVGFSDVDSALSTTSENPVQNKVITGRSWRQRSEQPTTQPPQLRA